MNEFDRVASDSWTSAGSVRPNSHEQANLARGVLARARAQGLIHRFAEDDYFDGRTITLDGRKLVNFGSCSYLGLETDARLKAAACDAVNRYGVQFSSSRTYLAVPLYRELEALLSEMAGGAPVVLAATASLAHLSALPALVGERDAVLYDIQVHASVQAALPELRQRGVVCEPVAHNRLDRLEQRVQLLQRSHERIFYLADGVYSMHGDSLDARGLYELLDRQPELFAYVDDAHGCGWSGARGAGTLLGGYSIHERMVVVFGLSKSFGSAGGAIVLPDRTLADRVLLGGRTLIFSGPIQPAQLGAGIASAKIHLSPELPLLQAGLQARMEAFDHAVTNAKLTTTAGNPAPIRFLPVGDEQRTADIVTQLMARGYFVNVAMYPAVARRRAGVRLMLTAHQTLADIANLVGEMAHLLASPPNPRSGGPKSAEVAAL
jgi:7-keto-8-aminopelargonate synthetase-like enzyme